MRTVFFILFYLMFFYLTYEEDIWKLQVKHHANDLDHLRFKYPVDDLDHLRSQKNRDQYQHTDVYNQYWDGSNRNYSFFDNTTFGIDVYTNPCTKIPKNTQFK